MKVTSMQNEIPKIIPILQRSFQDEGIPIACFFILTIYHKCLLFQFIGCGIPLQILVLTDFPNGRIIC